MVRYWCKVVLVCVLVGCTSVPSAPRPSARLTAVGLEGYERDKGECERDARAVGKGTELRPREVAFPAFLVGAGVSIGLLLEYGTPFDASKDPRYDGNALLGLSVGGFVVGTALSALSVWYRTRAHDAFVISCLSELGYDVAP